MWKVPEGNYVLDYALYRSTVKSRITDINEQLQDIWFLWQWWRQLITMGRNQIGLMMWPLWAVRGAQVEDQVRGKWQWTICMMETTSGITKWTLANLHWLYICTFLHSSIFPDFYAHFQQFLALSGDLSGQFSRALCDLWHLPHFSFGRAVCDVQLPNRSKWYSIGISSFHEPCATQCSRSCSTHWEYKQLSTNEWLSPYWLYLYLANGKSEIFISGLKCFIVWKSFIYISQHPCSVDIS